MSDSLTHSPIAFANCGPEFPRALRGLRFWILVKTHGATKFGQMVDKNMAQARFLDGLIKDSPNLELLVSGPLPIVKFRYQARGDYRRKPRTGSMRALSVKSKSEALPSRRFTPLAGNPA